MEVRWLKRALDSLDSTARYIEHDNPDAARDLLHTIRLKTEQLATYPFMGRASEKPDIREFFVHAHYLVSYRIRPGRIEILQVCRKAQDREVRS